MAEGDSGYTPPMSNPETPMDALEELRGIAEAVPPGTRISYVFTGNVPPAYTILDFVVSGSALTRFIVSPEAVVSFGADIRQAFAVRTGHLAGNVPTRDFWNQIAEVALTILAQKGLGR